MDHRTCKKRNTFKPLSKENLLDSVQSIVKSDGRPTPFTDGRPGKVWFYAFLKRHPDLGQRNPESICRGRGSLTEGCIRGWFLDCEKFFKERNLEYVLRDPTRQYNGDETGFQIDPKTSRVIAPVGEVVYTESGGNKEQMTVLITTRADGILTTPAVVYPYKRGIPLAIIKDLPSGFSAARSDSGWMTSAVFYEYMANTFIPELALLRRQQKGLHADEQLVLDEDDWVVYWIDGYSSHLTVHTSKLCELNRIILYCFKAHASHICQPNDVGPFKPLKQEWRSAVSEWRLQNPYEVLTRGSFASVLSTALQRLNPEAIRAGYRATGLYPFDAEAVKYERLTATNRTKYDRKAFGESSVSSEKYRIAMDCIAELVGTDVVSRYNSAMDSGIETPEAGTLPEINLFEIWKCLRLANSTPIEFESNTTYNDNVVQTNSGKFLHLI